MRRLHRLAAAGLIAVSAAATAQGPRLAILQTILPGNWQLREIGSAATPRALCVRDTALLLQMRHGASQCARFVVSDGTRSATIHYTCPGLGHGRTTITLESPTALRLQTQGIADGAPFDYDYEARRLGDCGDAR